MQNHLPAGGGHGKRLIVETNLPARGLTAMTATAKNSPSVVSTEALLGQQGELFKRLLKESLQEVLEAEMTEVVGAPPGERTAERSGYRAGYYSRSLVTRIGKVELRVPRDRDGRFCTELFERYQRSEKALVSALTAQAAACSATVANASGQCGSGRGTGAPASSKRLNTAA